MPYARSSRSWIRFSFVELRCERTPRGPLGLGDPCLRGLPRGPRLLLGGGLRLPRLGQPRLGLHRRSTRLPRLSLGPLAAPPEREPLPTRIPRVSRPTTLPGHHPAPPEPVSARYGSPATGSGNPQ